MHPRCLVSSFGLQPLADQQYYSALYGGLVAATLVVGMVRSALFFATCLRSSRNIFFAMLRAILRVPAQFFAVNPHGRILNRFAKDQVHSCPRISAPSFRALIWGDNGPMARRSRTSSCR